MIDENDMEGDEKENLLNDQISPKTTEPIKPIIVTDEL
jgi:hypothetical protein